MAKAKDLTGMRFGRLTVIERAENDKRNHAMWICQCDCGNITRPIRSSHLRDGSIQSCGCLQKEVASDTTKKLWQDEEYRQMKIDKTKKQWENEEFRQMHRDIMRDITKKLWQDEEFRQMRSDITRKQSKERWQDEEYRNKLSGENRYNWQGGITPISMYLRGLNREWFDKCKQECNYTCQLTGKQGQLHTHHLYAFSFIVLDAHNTHNIEIKEQVKDYTDEELKLLEDYVADWHKDNSNAVVLSEEAHKLFHSIYGKGNNTPEQYEEFRQRYLNGEFVDLI